MVKRKLLWIVCGIAALLLLLVFVNLGGTEEQRYFDPAGVDTSDGSTPAEQEPEEAEPYVSPVDFDGLHEMNEDIYAWLYIPDTEVSYPVLQHPEDDAHYLRRNVDGNYDIKGVLFTEASYNSKDFSDPVTIIYGHNMKSGEMFGALQRIYSSEEGMKEHSEIIVYLPERELHYTVFAAVPFDKRHILYNYDFTDERTFRLFFQEIMSIHALNAVYAEDKTIQFGDNALILSTCLNGDRSKRFLVCGKLSQTISTGTVK